jgi:diphosphomevalonate decarboxylase
LALLQKPLKTIFAKIVVKMTATDFVPLPYSNQKQEGKVTWKSPSNIALVKYWGKKKDQIPANPSISFTLDTCATTTTLTYAKRQQPGADFAFNLLFEGRPKSDFEAKISLFFSRIERYLPFLREYQFSIETSNSFPHSSGIASSASGMSALALCLMSLERQLHPEMDSVFFNQKASFLARLGSGSACRSIEGDMMLWGNHPDTVGSSDLFAIRYPFEVHKGFKNFQDTILLVDKGQKQVSSSVGHDLMQNHPYAARRFQQAHENLCFLQTVFASGDLEKFIAIVESEALTLHAMMMTAQPYFMLMRPHTLEVISKIWHFRKSSGTPICFTLDAGANVHVLYPESARIPVLEFIKNELVVYCENGQYICDQIGDGAKQLL